jgi:hypothetical protein
LDINVANDKGDETESTQFVVDGPLEDENTPHEVDDTPHEVEVFVYGDFYGDDDDDEFDDDVDDVVGDEKEAGRLGSKSNQGRRKNDSSPFDTNAYHSSVPDYPVRIDDYPPLYIVQSILSGLPSLLNLNIETNLQPKVDYLVKRLGHDQFAVAVMNFPPLLGYSLEKRIKPRVEQMMLHNIPMDKLVVAITKTDNAFNEWIDVRLDEIAEDRPMAKRGRPKKEENKNISKKEKGSEARNGKKLKDLETTDDDADDGVLESVLDSYDVDDDADQGTSSSSSSSSRDFDEDDRVQDGPDKADDSHDDDDGSRWIVEGGGRIIHWRR